MEDLSLHILDIAENALTAGARNLSIEVQEDHSADLLTVAIADDGRGMSSEIAARAADPFTTTRTTRKVGLGLALLREAAVAAGGGLEIRSSPGKGTTVTATFRLGHIDRKPLGSMAETILALLAAPGQVEIVYRHARDGRVVAFDTKEIRRRLEGLPIHSTEVLRFVRDYLTQEEASLQQ
jgi:anti-sigma regulatory factor (Ser/Thr protein kinase)